MKDPELLRDGADRDRGESIQVWQHHELQKTNILLVRKILRDMIEAGIEVPGGI
jgi:hypothetical protein